MRVRNKKTEKTNRFDHCGLAHKKTLSRWKVILTALFAFLAFSSWLYLKLEKKYLPILPKKAKKSRYALLLGCPSHDDGTLATSQIKRCRLAIKDYDKGLYETLIISGGAVKNQYVEAEAMKTYIHEFRAIPIIMETEARSTWDNFKNTRELIGDEPILILSGSLHKRRSAAIAGNFFTDFTMDSYTDLKPKHIFREFLSRLKYIWIESHKSKSTQKDEDEKMLKQES